MGETLKKICTKCLVEKSSNDFYSKGNRLDSICKECKRSNRKAKYVSKKQCDEFNSLTAFFEIIFDSEIEELKRLNQNCDRILRSHQQKEAA